MGQKKKGNPIKVFFVCFALFFLGATITALAENESNPSPETAAKEEKKAAMEKALEEMDSKASPEAAKNKDGEASSQEAGKEPEDEKEALKKKIEANEKLKEKEFFVKAAEVSWKLSEESILVQINGPGGGDVPAGKLVFEQEGLLARWKPATLILMKRKKRNKLDSPWVSEIFFREDAAKTKALGAPPPYYALDEIQLRFTELVSSDVLKRKQGLRLEFRPLKKRKPVVVEEEPREQDILLNEPAPFTPGQILGPVYQAKNERAAGIIGKSRAAEMLGRLQTEYEPQKDLFDSKNGFPQDVRPIFEEAYPAFGSLDYWKKYVRAVFEQTAGFSSDYDGNYGAWSGFRANNPAMTWTPDLAVGYYRPGVISRSVAYQYTRRCPVSRLLHFADGHQNQAVSIGAGYAPRKPYAVFSENSLSFFRSKDLDQNSDGSITRRPNNGLRMTNALGLNYRLTRKLIWKICTGLERTRSDNDKNGRSRTNMGFLGFDLGYSFSKNLSGGLGYSYRHTFKDTGAPSGPSTKWAKEAKGNDLQAPSAGLKYKPFKKLALSGSITPAIIDGQYYKFGGETSLNYQCFKMDDFSFNYSNAVAQDDTAQLTGRNVSGGIGAAGSVALTRDETITFGYNHWLTEKKMRLSLSVSYKRSLPLHGLSSTTGNLQDGLSFEASLRRKLRGGSLWMEVTYRFENYRQRALDWEESLDSSVKEHAVYFSITNYFGQKGG